MTSLQVSVTSKTKPKVVAIIMIVMLFVLVAAVIIYAAYTRKDNRVVCTQTPLESNSGNDTSITPYVDAFPSKTSIGEAYALCMAAEDAASDSGYNMYVLHLVPGQTSGGIVSSRKTAFISPVDPSGTVNLSHIMYGIYKVHVIGSGSGYQTEPISAKGFFYWDAGSIFMSYGPSAGIGGSASAPGLSPWLNENYDSYLKLDVSGLAFNGQELNVPWELVAQNIFYQQGTKNNSPFVTAAVLPVGTTHVDVYPGQPARVKGFGYRNIQSQGVVVVGAGSVSSESCGAGGTPGFWKDCLNVSPWLQFYENSSSQHTMSSPTFVPSGSRLDLSMGGKFPFIPTKVQTAGEYVLIMGTKSYNTVGRQGTVIIVCKADISLGVVTFATSSINQTSIKLSEMLQNPSPPGMSRTYIDAQLLFVTGSSTPVLALTHYTQWNDSSTPPTHMTNIIKL